MEFKEKIAKFAKITKDHSEQLERNEKVWIQQIRALYKDIESWFSEYIQEGDIDVVCEHLHYFEHLEETIDTMYFKIGGGEGFAIILEPASINVVGAIGKIDLYFRGHRDEGIFLLLIEEEEQFYWEMRKSGKQVETETFSRKTFEQLIDKWSNKWSDKWANLEQKG